MRNTLEYPVNMKEKIDLLQRYIDEFNQSDPAPGDMIGLILDEIICDVVELDYVKSLEGEC